mgnify:CR=1 FL=1
MIHIGKNTKSTIISKGISAGKSNNSYRGLVKVMPSAKGARNFSQCDSLLMGNECGAHTFPYIEVANQLSNINNLQQSYTLRSQQVQALTQSIDISARLFKSARADYMEVLLTQRDALESKFELVETKKQQMVAMVNVYQALGGGWER